MGLQIPGLDWCLYVIEPGDKVVRPIALTAARRQIRKIEPHGRVGRNLHMKCPSRSLTTAIAGACLGLLAREAPAHAADIPLKAPAMATVFDWTGLYIGAHTGFSRGASSAILNDPAPSTTRNVFDGQIGGVQAGYNYRSSSRRSGRCRSRHFVSELFHVEQDRVLGDDGELRASSKPGTTSERRAAASAMPRVPPCSTLPAALPGPANVSPIRPRSEPRKRS